MGRGRSRATVVAPPPRQLTAGIVGRLERLLHRIGVRLLSQSWLPVLVWLLMLVALVVNASTMPSLYDAIVPIALVVAVLQSAALVWALTRPRFAVGVATVAVAATTLLTAVGRGELPWPIPVITLVTVALMVFLLAVREKWSVPVAGAVLPVAAAAVAGMPWHDGGWGPFATNLITAISILALVVTFGILIHQWLQSRAELLEQQEIAVTAQERRLLMEERNRIARELHDVVAHGLSVISIQASTLRYRIEGVPPEALVELDDITESARRALVEMRGLLAVLRKEDGQHELAPQPTMSFLPNLVASTRRGINPVRLHVTGRLDDPQVSEATSLSVYRIVQEALSNALRHAPGSEIDVSITVADEHVVLAVENSPSIAPARGSDSKGFGLRGMRERASFVRGSLSAEPLPGGGFLVHAVLPCRQVDDQTTDSAEPAHPPELPPASDRRAERSVPRPRGERVPDQE
ncbi:sensor histidine kinase [Pseudactinotalea suaedae]|uniref:sensor histidine kinase n=1 Tax=Pseudactinotalea suaedae TaxID=1524924 RepID=UPI0012E23FFB|nr:sensor histidine kinase [Pseudactinotalea suaedae]